MFTIKPINSKDAEEISSWQYPVPYSIYSLAQDEIPILLNPENQYISVYDGSGQLFGYCCFGEEAKVPGGKYFDRGHRVLDIGLGMRPDQVGKGKGKSFIAAILEFALDEFKPTKFRVSIVAFNLRSRRAFQKQGFTELSRFKRTSDGMEFVQLERDAIL